MNIKTLLIILSLFFTSLIFANGDALDQTYEDGYIAGAKLKRSESIPLESIKGVNDPYFEGYIQALIDMHFHEYKVIVLVKDHTVWLANTPKNALISNSIISFVKDVPGVEDVKILDGMPPKEIVEREKYVNRPKICGIWFPQVTELYLPMIANPRQVIYSLAYRGGDKVMGKKSVQVALGDDFPVFRWIDVFPFHGDLQIGIEAGIWSVFNIDPQPVITRGTELVNTDFYVGIPLTYAVNKWAYRLRIYHISSHLGDEFMVNHPTFERVNPSFEALDLFISFQANQALRFYVGGGTVLHSDSTYPMDHGYIEYGGEARFLSSKFYYQRLYGTFFAAVYFRNWQFQNWDIDQTYMLGYEWSKLQGIGRKIRICASFHHGFSAEGQFAKKRTTYGTIGFAYGF